ncbi:MAG: hypothetical protein J6B85_03975 [Lachnospiraceae bacterium]|nr:hypothetical protein [Lachnospiraceae bacterium]
MSDAQLKELEALYGVEVAWASKLNLTDVFNVKDYGAVGDGKTDDREAFQEALNTAAKNGGGIVYLPEGTYHMGNATTGVSIPNGIIVAGDGQDKTVIMTDQKFSFEAFYGGIARLTLQSDLKRPEDDEERRTSGYVGPLLYSGSGTCFFAKEVTVKAADGCGFRGQTSRQIVIEDCSFEVTHNGLNVLGCRSRIRGNYVRNTQRAIMAFGTYSWVDGNVFDGANGGDDCEKVYSGRYAGQVNTMEHRICDMEGDKLYYGNNTIIGMIGDAREDKEDNCGEGILNQESARIAISTVTSTGENTLTADLDFNAILEGNDPYAGKNGTKLIGARIYLVSGKGMGQRRSIIGVLGNTLLLDSEWDYPPQEGDSFMINAGVPERNIIVNNDIQAETRKGGIMYYGCSYDNIIADNTMTNGGGIWFGQAQNSSQARTGLSYFNYVDGNFLSGGIPAKNVSARENTLTIGPGDDGGCGITLDPILPELTAYYGNLYRNNTIEGNGTDIEASGTYNAKFVVHNGINVATVSEETLDYNKGTIVANNTVTNSMNGVSVSSLSNFTLLYQNNFTGNKVNYNDTGSRNLVTMNGEKLAEQTAPVDSEAVGIAAVISDLE